MAIFGYLIYAIITLWVTAMWFGVMSWPTSKGEKVFITAITGIFWFGAYHWFPFTVTIT